MAVACAWMVLCKQVIVDQQNNVSLVVCIEQLQVRDFPATLGEWSLVALLYRSPSEDAEHAEVPLRLIVEPPGRGSVVLATFSSEFPPGRRRNRVHVKLSGLQLASTGCYTFVLEGDGGRMLARLPLDVGASAEPNDESPR